jgi:aspartate/methionine/tyrosine aminotransferase
MQRIDAIEPFRVMQLLERARELEAEGRDIVHMEIGEPDLPPPPQAAQAAIAAIKAGESGYTPSTGLPQLKSALSDWYKRHHGVDIDPKRILITPGASGAFLVLYLVLLENGESVLLPDPGYPCQRNFVRLAGGTPVSVPVGPDGHYHMTAGDLKDFWANSGASGRGPTGRGHKAVVVTSPGNPTGTLIDKEEFCDIAAACRSRGATLISDEIYHGLVYEDEHGHAPKVVSALEIDDDAVVVNGFSKRWAMTGYRVGWMVVPEKLVDPCTRVMQNIFIAATTISQHAALAALSPESEAHVEATAARYGARRQILLDALPKLGFKIAVEPEGAFYIYTDASALTDDAEAFCADVLESAGVAITPGADFGSYRANIHVRFSYATSRERIEEGIKRLGDYLDARG